MGLSREQAVREAQRYTTWPHAYCAAFVQRVFGWGWVGASAIDAWNRAQHKHTSYPPPPGVPCYWGPKGRNPYGHIAVSLGGGKCRSSDYPASGRVGTVDIRWIETHWPNTGRYLGWSDDIAGHIIPGGGTAAPPPARPQPEPSMEEPDMVIIRRHPGPTWALLNNKRITWLTRDSLKGHEGVPVIDMDTPTFDAAFKGYEQVRVR